VANMTDLGVSEGFFHLFEGWIFFIVTFALTLLLCRVLLKKAEWDTLGRGYFTVDTSEVKPSSTARYQSFIAISMVILIFPLAVFARGSVVVIPERASFVSFPLKIDGHIGKKQQLSMVEQNALKMTDHFLGSYEPKDGPPISLFIGYFEAQSKGNAPHSPDVCIPGGGWKITSMRTIEIPASGKVIQANRVIIAKGDLKQLVYYWFQQGGNSYASSYIAKTNILWRGITSSRTDGALVRLVKMVDKNTPEDVVDSELREFVASLSPVLFKFVPN